MYSNFTNVLVLPQSRLQPINIEAVVRVMVLIEPPTLQAAMAMGISLLVEYRCSKRTTKSVPLQSTICTIPWIRHQRRYQMSGPHRQACREALNLTLHLSQSECFASSASSPGSPTRDASLATVMKALMRDAVSAFPPAISFCAVHI